MKLAKIVLPLLDNNGKDLFMEHQELQHCLLLLFGGFTRTEGGGNWKDKHGKVYAEPVAIYDVAIEHAECPTFRALAETTARRACQQSVMIVTPNGDVEFVHGSRLTEVSAQA